MSLTKFIQSATIVLAVLVPVTMAMALGDGMPESPAPEEYSPLWGPLAFTALFLVAVGVLGFKGARRTHLN